MRKLCKYCIDEYVLMLTLIYESNQFMKILPTQDMHESVWPTLSSMQEFDWCLNVVDEQYKVITLIKHWNLKGIRFVIHSTCSIS